MLNPLLKIMWVNALIILEDVLIKGFDNRIYRVSFHVKPNVINAIVTPALFDKERLANAVLGLTEPESGKIFFLKKPLKKCYYSSTQLLPQYRDISSYVEEYASRDVLRKLLEKTRVLGYAIDENTCLCEIPYPLRVFTSLYTLVNSDNELCVFVDPFEYLDDVLISLIGVEMSDAVKRGRSILVISSNENAIKKIHASNVLDITLGLRRERFFVEEKTYLSSCVLAEVYVKEGVLNNCIIELLNHKWFRGFIMKNNKVFLLAEKKFKAEAIRYLSKLFKEKKVRGFKVVEVE